MTLNSSGIRDISWVLGISVTTVSSALRKAYQQLAPLKKPEKVVSVEVDEQWSYVGNKGFQRWLWIAWDRHRKQVLDYVIGFRTDATGFHLLQKLEPYQIERFYTDHWPFYEKAISPEKHRIGKRYTQQVERNNLNLRTHLKRLQRRTICFSKSDEMHKAVIGLYMHQAMIQHQF